MHSEKIREKRIYKSMMKIKENQKSIQQVQNDCQERLKLGGSIHPEQESRLLLSYLLNMDFNSLYLNKQNMISGERISKIDEWVKLRNTGMPIQYITGYQNFMGLEFIVSPGVFIPRPETEILVENIIQIINKDSTKKNYKILDLGVGTGIIPITICHHFHGCFKHISFDAVDISKKATELAQKNAEKFCCHQQIKFFTADLFSPYQGRKNKKLFDCVISNPPYITQEEVLSLPREVGNYEPIKALYGGCDGLDYYQRIIDESPVYLKEDGFLALEIGHKQKNVILSMIQKTEYFCKKVLSIQDYFQHDRVVIAFAHRFRG